MLSLGLAHKCQRHEISVAPRCRGAAFYHHVKFGGIFPENRAKFISWRIHVLKEFSRKLFSRRLFKKAIMKKKIITRALLSIFALCTIFTIWISEPISINPFAAYDLPKVESTTDSDCSKQIQQSADKLVNELIDKKGFMSVSTGTYQKDCGMYLATAGFANKKDQQRPNNETLYRTASIGKPITAVAIMQLFERGVLNLDVPIQQYLPEFPKKEKGEITIKQLLSHTSGVRHYHSTVDGISFKHYDSLIDAIDEFKDDPLEFGPGTSYLYSTYGYTILGAIIEKVSGLSFEEHMRKNIFEPANMNHTSLENANRSYENKASLYIKFKNKFIKSPNTDLSVKYPGGGYITTAEDMLLFGKALLEYQLITKETIDKMGDTSVHHKKGTPYGFGWFVYEHERKGKILMHGGSQSGASSEFNIVLDQGLVTVALSNTFGCNFETQQLVFQLADLIEDRLDQ